jgi:hypothetical protein
MLVDIDVFGDSIGRVFEPGSTDYKRAAYALDGAEGIVLDHLGRESEWLTAEQLPRTVCTVIYELAGRKFANPKGLISRGVGPLSEGMSPEAAAGLALSDAEQQQIARFVSTKGGLQSVELVRPDCIGNETIYVSDSDSLSVMRIPYADAEDAHLFPDAP